MEPPSGEAVWAFAAARVSRIATGIRSVYSQLFFMVLRFSEGVLRVAKLPSKKPYRCNPYLTRKNHIGLIFNGCFQENLTSGGLNLTWNHSRPGR